MSRWFRKKSEADSAVCFFCDNRERKKGELLVRVGQRACWCVR